MEQRINLSVIFPADWPWLRYWGRQDSRPFAAPRQPRLLTFAGVAIPEMDRYGYDSRLSTGIVATVGTLGVIIPPSVTLIIFGIITEQSIGRLFIAGIIPGLMIALSFSASYMPGQGLIPQ